MRITKVPWAVAIAGAAVLTLPALAQACLVPGTSASLTMSGPGSGAADAYNSVGMFGPVGSYVSVRGEGWEQGRPVQFSWGTTVPGTTELTTLPDTDSSFQVTVKVPSGKPGEIYLISASQPDAQNAALRTGTGHPFLVTNPDGSLPADVPQESSPSGATSAVGSGRLAASPAAAATEHQPPVAAEGLATSAASTVVVPGAAPSGSPVPPVAVPGHESAPRATEAPTPRRAGASAPAARADTAPEAAVTSSLRTVTGELWSGVSADGGRLPAASLLSVPGSPASGPSPTQLTAGLLGIGVLALLGGFSVAELRRRRVPVGATS